MTTLLETSEAKMLFDLCRNQQQIIRGLMDHCGITTDTSKDTAVERAEQIINRLQGLEPDAHHNKKRVLPMKRPETKE